MAKKKQSNFLDLVGNQPTINSIEDDKNKNIESIASKVTKIQKTLDSERIKKLFKNSTSLNKFIEKHNQEQKQTSVDKKTTKIDQIEDVGVLDMLSKILGFMQKTHDEDKMSLEKQQNFSEELESEKARKQKSLLDALKKKKGLDKPPTTEKEEEDSFLGLFGELGGVLFNVAKFFLANPLGLAILGGVGALAAILLSSNEANAEANKVRNAGDVSAEGAAITNIEGSDRRKAKILRKAYESGELKQQGGWWSPTARIKEGKQEQKYLEDIGFDPKTGLTQADRDKGYNYVDDETGEASYSKFFDKEGKPKTGQDLKEVSTPTASAPTSAPAPAAAAPAPVEGAGSQLNSVVSQNNDMKLQESSVPAVSSVVNQSTNVNTTKAGGVSKQIPPVRNQESTFQRMIVYSTRVV